MTHLSVGPVCKSVSISISAMYMSCRRSLISSWNALLTCNQFESGFSLKSLKSVIEWEIPFDLMSCCWSFSGAWSWCRVDELLAPVDVSNLVSINEVVLLVNEASTISPSLSFIFRPKICFNLKLGLRFASPDVGVFLGGVKLAVPKLRRLNVLLVNLSFIMINERISKYPLSNKYSVIILLSSQWKLDKKSC